MSTFQSASPPPRRGDRVLLLSGRSGQISEVINVSPSTYSYFWPDLDGGDAEYETTSPEVEVDMNSWRDDKATYTVAWNGFCWEETP